MSESIVFIFFLLVFAHCQNSKKTTEIQVSMENLTFLSADTLLVNYVVSPPVIDVNALVNTWSRATWYPINLVWILYGAEIVSNMYYGRYKSLWSEKENLLNILAEITDDNFVGGHQYHPDRQIGGRYADHDIIEIFIDEDKSGGLHAFDGTGTLAEQWGSNAENAFACHNTIDTPETGETNTRKRTLDIAGNGWDEYYNAYFQDHLPQFAVNRNGIYYTSVLSLKVFNANYHHQNPDALKLALFPGKVIGYSVAYCNNDDLEEEPKRCDHFFYLCGYQKKTTTTTGKM